MKTSFTNIQGDDSPNIFAKFGNGFNYSLQL